MAIVRSEGQDNSFGLARLCWRCNSGPSMYEDMHDRPASIALTCRVRRSPAVSRKGMLAYSYLPDQNSWACFAFAVAAPRRKDKSVPVET
jgi:hypothetical protein